MILFQPDLFSKCKPRYVALPVKSRRSLDDVLRCFYADRIGYVRKIDQLQRKEINSRNYKISTTKGVFLLKERLRCGKKELQKLQLQFRVVNRAIKKGVSFPRLIPSMAGEPAIFTRKRLWILMEFEDGRYFDGKKNELFHLIQSEGKLFHLLRSIRAERSFATRDYFTVRETKTINQYLSQRKRTSPFHSLIVKNYSVLESVYQETRQAWKRIQTLPSHICHIDLHPHNVLFQSKRIFFLDMDSLMYGKQPVCLGYSLFKLIRQTICAARLNGNRLLNGQSIFRDCVKLLIRSGGLQPQEAVFLRSGAQLEILKRIIYILADYESYRSVRWAHLLPNHLNAIQEINFIFGKI